MKKTKVEAISKNHVVVAVLDFTEGRVKIRQFNIKELMEENEDITDRLQAIELGVENRLHSSCEWMFSKPGKPLIIEGV